MHCVIRDDKGRFLKGSLSGVIETKHVGEAGAVIQLANRSGCVVLVILLNGGGK